jgi:hypothetical protein
MANVWHGPLPIGRSPDTLPRHPWRIPVALWIVALAIPLAVVMFFLLGFILFAQALGNGFNSFGRGLEQALKADQAAGTAANDAAAAVGPQFGSLSPSVLNMRLLKYQWVAGTANVPYSAKRPIVGMVTNGTHIETAIQDLDGSCSFGLTITSSTDPLTTQNHVLGLGKYYRLVGPGTYYQSVYNAPQCAADQAPASGWISWPQSVP